ncbi:hypothetical protein ACF0H5_003830 [Mactra antiquata]
MFFSTHQKPRIPGITRRLTSVYKETYIQSKNEMYNIFVPIFQMILQNVQNVSENNRQSVSMSLQDSNYCRFKKLCKFVQCGTTIRVCQDFYNVDKSLKRETWTKHADILYRVITNMCKMPVC